MDHKHLDIKELFDLAAEDEGKGMPEKASDCESCKDSLKKTRYLVDKMTEKNNDAVEEIYRDLSKISPESK